eukprot:CAMPEP_0174855026 /NCGR_PEP_ID=MMETSP1114-20130205/32279_1 /TAXON_ID=312471 /ORGANISM="Neobodo designis, Strain CCAP 1951/1" /LENGTH=222 /DNA_ID=CAMNT_0016089737 /DNA_START=35 /DNA_END=700 /DNA_ORIENTATION=-
MDASRQWANVQPVVHDNIHQLNQLIREHHARINELLQHTASLERHATRIDEEISSLRGTDVKSHAPANASPTVVAHGSSHSHRFDLDTTRVESGVGLLRWRNQAAQKSRRAVVLDACTGFVTVEVMVAFAREKARPPAVLVNGSQVVCSWTAADAPPTTPQVASTCKLGHTAPWCDQSPAVTGPARGTGGHCAACSGALVTTFHTRVCLWAAGEFRIAIENL